MLENFINLLSQNPEMATAMITSLFATYKPVLYSLLSDIFDIYKDLVNNDEWFDVNAKYYKKYFDALVSQGFSDKQALQILLSLIDKAKNLGNSSGGSIKLNKN